MKFEVIFFKVNDLDRCPLLNIESEDFSYANIKNMYKGKTSGHGIQTNGKYNEEALLKMCDRISDAVLKYDKEINNE